MQYTLIEFVTIALMPEPMIIAENTWLLAINKPAGLITHFDGRTEELSLSEWLLERCPHLVHVGNPWVSPQEVRVPIAGLIHRLDRTTSGIILAAKSNESFTFFKNELKMRRVRKCYRAWVYGHVEGEQGRVVAAIERSKQTPKRWEAVPCDASHRRAAITEWRVLRRVVRDNVSVSYIEVHPVTGRTHQIRVHCASVGYAIVEDHLYAPHMPLLGFLRPALHALSISINVPNGERHTYTAPVPQEFLDHTNLAKTDREVY